MEQSLLDDKIVDCHTCNSLEAAQELVFCHAGEVRQLINDDRV